MANHKRVSKSVRFELSIEQAAFDKFEQDYLKEKLLNTKLSKGEFLSNVIMSYLTAMDGGHDGTVKRKTCT